MIQDDFYVEIVTWSRQKRISWHKDRVALEQVPYDFLESLQTEKTDEELVDELLNVKQEMRKLSDLIKLLECKEFNKARLEYLYHSTMAKERKSRLFHAFQARNYKQKMLEIGKFLDVCITCFLENS